MKERIVIIVLAVNSGLAVTIMAFFVYQNFFSESKKAQDVTRSEQKQEVTENLLLEIDEPLDGAVTDKRTISVKGITNPENVVIVSSNLEDNSGTPSTDGKFSITILIDAGANILVVRSIAPDGRETKKEYTITYNTEEF